MQKNLYKIVLLISIALLISCSKGSVTITVLLDQTGKKTTSEKTVGHGPYAQNIHNALEKADSLFLLGHKKIIIRLLSGEYTLRQTLLIKNKTLATKNRQLIFMGQKGKTTLIGGQQIHGIKTQNMFTAPLNKKNAPVQLFLHNKRKYMARYPNESAITLKYLDSDSVYKRKYIPITKELYHHLKILSWEEKQQAKIRLLHKWMAYNYSIADVFTDSVFYRIDKEKQKVSFIGTGKSLPLKKKEQLKKAVKATKEYFAFPKYLLKIKGDLPCILPSECPRIYLEGTNAFMDKPSEWTVQNDSLNYLLGQKKLLNQNLYMPILNQLIKIEGTQKLKLKNIHFYNIHFSYTSCIPDYKKENLGQAAYKASAAVEIAHAENISFTNCQFTSLGSYAIWFSQGTSASMVKNTYFRDLGAGAIKIGALDKRSQQPTGIKIENCNITKGGRIFPNAVAIWIGNSSNNKIIDNQISDFYYTAISVGWTWGYGETKAKNNLIKRNHIHKIGQEKLSDLGGIYTLGKSQGTLIENNLIHNVSSYLKHQCSGIYADEGSSYLNIKNNIIYHCSGSGFHLHYGRENTFENNILAFNGYGQIRCSGAEQHKMLTIKHNIICFSEETPLIGPWDYIWAHMHHNCYWRKGGQKITFAGKSLEKWQKYHRDKNSIIGNPNFNDSKNKDFWIKNKSIIKQIGFTQITPLKNDKQNSRDRCWHIGNINCPNVEQPPQSNHI